MAIVAGLLCVLGVQPVRAQEASLPPEVSAGDGTLYLGGFPSRIFVIDEATTRVVDEIAVPHGSPRAMVVSEDGERFYFLDPTMQYLTTVDVASREVTDSFRFSEGNRTVRIRGFRAAPDGRTALLTHRHRGQADRPLRGRAVPAGGGRFSRPTRSCRICRGRPGTRRPDRVSCTRPDGEYVYHFGPRRHRPGGRRIHGGRPLVPCASRSSPAVGADAVRVLHRPDLRGARLLHQPVHAAPTRRRIAT